MKKYLLILISKSIILIFSFLTFTEEASAFQEFPCTEACNEDICYTHYMDPCIYTWCQLDEDDPGGKDDPGGTTMCLGERIHDVE